jgi:hypothetical protein
MEDATFEILLSKLRRRNTGITFFVGRDDFVVDIEIEETPGIAY